MSRSTPPGYTDFFRRHYAYDQEHRVAGQARLLHVPHRPAGMFDEPPVRGITLQISRTSRAGPARLDLGAGRFGGDLREPFFIVAPAGQTCRYELPSELDLLIVEFAPTAFELHLQSGLDLGRMHSAGWREKLPLLLADHLWAASANKLGQLEADSLACSLAGMLARLSAQPLRAPAPRGGLAPRQLKQVTEHLSDRLADSVSLQDLAALTGLSPSHLCRAFKQSTGLPPHRWQMARRIERARALLANSSANITEIAGAVGYDDPGQLATAFRKATGLTPSQYREERRS